MQLGKAWLILYQRVGRDVRPTKLGFMRDLIDLPEVTARGFSIRTMHFEITTFGVHVELNEFEDMEDLFVSIMEVLREQRGKEVIYCAQRVPKLWTHWFQHQGSPQPNDSAH